jgi:hypothetical protein
MEPLSFQYRVCEVGVRGTSRQIGVEAICAYGSFHPLSVEKKSGLPRPIE